MSGALTGMYAYKKRRETSQTEPFVRADGTPKHFSTKMQEMGSKILQRKDPLKGILKIMFLYRYFKMNYL